MIKSILNNLFNERYMVDYLTGVKAADTPITGVLYLEKDGIHLNIGFKHHLRTKWENILDIQVDEQGKVSSGISLGKTALGYVLAGPAGALIGAAIKSKKDERVLFLTLPYKDDDGTQNILVMKTKDAYTIFNVLTSRWEKACKEKGIDVQKLKSGVSITSDSAFQTLTYQKDKGIITQEEYKAKMKLLKQ